MLVTSVEVEITESMHSGRPRAADSDFHVTLSRRLADNSGLVSIRGRQLSGGRMSGDGKSDVGGAHNEDFADAPQSEPNEPTLDPQADVIAESGMAAVTPPTLESGPPPQRLGADIADSGSGDSPMNPALLHTNPKAGPSHAEVHGPVPDALSSIEREAGVPHLGPGVAGVKPLEAGAPGSGSSVGDVLAASRGDHLGNRVGDDRSMAGIAWRRAEEAKARLEPAGARAAISPVITDIALEGLDAAEPGVAVVAGASDVENHALMAASIEELPMDGETRDEATDSTVSTLAPADLAATTEHSAEDELTSTTEVSRAATAPHMGQQSELQVVQEEELPAELRMEPQLELRVESQPEHRPAAEGLQMSDSGRVRHTPTAPGDLVYLKKSSVESGRLTHLLATEAKTVGARVWEDTDPSLRLGEGGLAEVAEGFDTPSQLASGDVLSTDPRREDAASMVRPGPPLRLPTPVEPQQLVQVVRSVAEGTGDEVRAVRLQLHPESLGELQLRIATQQGAVSAHFVAESEAARRLIDAALPLLREQLLAQGMSVQYLGVSVGGEQRAAADQRHSSQPLRQRSLRVQRMGAAQMVTTAAVRGSDGAAGAVDLLA